MSDLEDQRELYIKKAKTLIKKYKKLNIIYLRVSTKDKQEELNQLPEISNAFNLELKECLIIQSRESAFQLKKDNFRIFNTVKEIIAMEEFEDIEKKLYVWHLNRIYRNREKLVDFGLDIKKCNAMIFSVRQKILSDCFKYPPPMNEIIYYLMLQLYGQSAQEESENKAQDLLKSLNKKADGRTYTYKGNLYGKKFKTIKGKNVTDPKEVDKIEKTILLGLKKNVPYRTIKERIKEIMKVNVSMGTISNLKNKHL